MFTKLTLVTLVGARALADCVPPEVSQYHSMGCTTPDCEGLNLMPGEAECQNLNNCPRYYNNTMDDYVAGADMSLDADLEAFMSSTLSTYLSRVESFYPPSKVDTADVFNGVGGRAFLHLRLYTRFGDDKYLASASEYIATSLANVDTIPECYVGFLWGSTGVYTLAAVIADMQNEGADVVQGYIDQVSAIFETATDDEVAQYDDFDSGRAGLIYAANFLKAHFGTDVIAREKVVAVAQAVLRRGLAQSGGEAYAEWISPNDGGKWLGQSHGSAGVLHELLSVPEVALENATSKAIIMATLDHVVSKQFPSGNFPAEYFDEDEDELVQWDHGAPGVLGSLTLAASVYATDEAESAEKYMASARLAADCVWERGLVVKGLMLCHGISGNTYMQLLMHKATKDDKYLYRALQFQRYVSKSPGLYDVSQMRKPTPSPYFLWIGSYESAIMLWSDFVANADDLTQASFPGYEHAI
mmetsp:Transcript_90085/g.257602  ORF Transcript_90085/g.257602 Transcript_90085/m.257602 type:complete len:471 (+) Transcript_90085:114-1526(+)|eukprot:CAMPEP_0119492652 /NCGR_PEP_ID=MMETSP1344-20130328/17132_1 /TAXON_ID=236787 /ORGANISM="Florenciella parvula, Strain CCMP2471" /LENGTH=470 /DNA_ID=CAMNT_0007528009 /DNA_START=94 /DNA_END=1506 /DNA_ORIENTATION=-